MPKHWLYLLFLVWFGYIIITSILLFTNGFLLTRIAHKNNSTFNPKKVETENLDRFLNDLITEPGHIRTQNRIILLVIDALRHDFTVYNETLENPAPYQNKLDSIHALLQNNKTNSRLYKFIADPPTTTMQRLKGITTGSLPTFIDAGSNFASSEIGEDNIIDQLNRAGHKIVCMGDDTWGNLYPGRFTRSFLHPSFNVWDLDSVDNEVRKHIYEEMAKPDWSLLIGHVLGVDHCGHRYGPSHAEMTRKLTEMNDLITNIVKEMDNRTILFVIGDHGMTSTGDHGGESPQEITAAMFVHSKQSLSDNILDNGNPVKHDSSVKQVDLVPTIAHIMGVPVPYANLGTVIFDSLPINTDINLTAPQWYHNLHAIWSNVVQVHKYIIEYVERSSSIDSDIADSAQSEFNRLKERLTQIKSERDFRLFAENAQKFIVKIRLSCEKVWTEFDAASMSRGLLLTSLVTFAVYLFVIGSATLDRHFIVLAYLGTFIAAIIGYVVYILSLSDNLVNTVYFSTGLFAMSYLFLLVAKEFSEISENLYKRVKSRAWIEVIGRFALLLTFVGLFTNSYIVTEAAVTLFIFITLTALIVLDLNYNSIFDLKRSTKKVVYATLFVMCILLRVSTYFWGCRDENDCQFTLNKWGNSNKLELCLALVSLAFFVTAAKIGLRSCGNLTGYSINVLLAKHLPAIIVVCCGGIWVLHHVPKDKLVVSWQSDFLAFVIYSLVILALGHLYAKPLHVHVLPTGQVTNVLENKDVIPHLFKQMKDTFGSDKGKEHSDVPIVYGLATVYTSAVLISTLYFALVYLLLLGDIVTPGGIVLLAIACLVLLISAISRYEKATSVEKLLEVPFSHLTLWFVLSIYAFYGTKHQPTFSSIAWEAAFVGTSHLQFTSNVLPAILVLINTFGSYIIFGFALPLLVITPFSIYAMFPALANKKHSAMKNLTRGDFSLLDYEQLVGTNVFSLCCQYVMCHTIRVFGCMLSATIHCRHLMVWAIFAPKLIFEAISLFVTILSVILGYLLIMRIQMTLNKFVATLTKKR